jgi:hypothetical protein
MAFTVKQWLNKVGSGTLLDAPDVNSETHLEAASLRDMETRPVLLYGLPGWRDNRGHAPGRSDTQPDRIPRRHNLD